jgi:hypothetical protein
VTLPLGDGEGRTGSYPARHPQMDGEPMMVDRRLDLMADARK